MKELLVIGIGNTGRGDDGLGWLFAEAFERAAGGAADVEFRYQLQVEDAELIANYAKVVFVDARSVGAAEPFLFQRLQPRESVRFTTHSVDPASVAALAGTLYGACPDCRLLTIYGNSYGLGIGISKTAAASLRAATEEFCSDGGRAVIALFGSPVEAF